MPRHRKRVKHFHEPGDVHELTFSCYRRLQLLTNNAWRGYLARAIDDACAELGCTLAAFVVMPEHVHLLIFGFQDADQVSVFLRQVKQPCSARVHADLTQTRSPLLKRLLIRERPGRDTFRYWQEGRGYDRNLQTAVAVQSAIDYLHLNPVRRKLCVNAHGWRWSSARFYASMAARSIRICRRSPRPLLSFGCS
jgi:putative transposase